MCDDDGEMLFVGIMCGILIISMILLPLSIISAEEVSKGYYNQALATLENHGIKIEEITKASITSDLVTLTYDEFIGKISTGETVKACARETQIFYFAIDGIVYTYNP